MGKKYLRYEPKQSLLLPPNLDDWLPGDHLARFVGDVVDDLDLSAIFDYYEREGRGAPPYNPRMMAKVRIYADAIGSSSSRVIEKALVDNVGFRYLGAGNFPDFRTINEFRRIHLDSLAALFHQVLDLCKQADLVKVGTVALDGTKVKASASIDKNFTLETLSKKENDLKELARKILEHGIIVDEEEDRIFGPDNNGWSLPVDALERVRKAKKQLEERKQKEQEEYERKIKERAQKEKESGKPLSGRKPKDPREKKHVTKDGKEKKPTANTTDPDSRIMKTRRGYIQGYNAQIVVDSDTQIILATDLTQDHNDLHQLVPMLEQTIQNTGMTPTNTTADAGYDNEEQISRWRDKTELFIPTQKDWKQRKAMKDLPPPRGRIPKHLNQRKRMERKLLTKRGKKVYKKRGSSVEPVFGQVKSIRGLGQCLLRGINKCKSEWKMYCTGHNLLKLWRKKNGVHAIVS